MKKEHMISEQMRAKLQQLGFSKNCDMQDLLDWLIDRKFYFTLYGLNPDTEETRGSLELAVGNDNHDDIADIRQGLYFQASKGQSLADLLAETIVYISEEFTGVEFTKKEQSSVSTVVQLRQVDLSLEVDQLYFLYSPIGWDNLTTDGKSDVAIKLDGDNNITLDFGEQKAVLPFKQGAKYEIETESLDRPMIIFMKINQGKKQLNILVQEW